MAEDPRLDYMLNYKLTQSTLNTKSMFLQTHLISLIMTCLIIF